MGLLILIQIDSAYLHLAPGDVQVLQGQQHIGLVLIPLPGHGGQPGQVLHGDGPQAGLGVRDGQAAEKPEHPAGDAVAHPGPGRDTIPGEVPAPQDQLPLLHHPAGAGGGVLRVVLAVAVHRHHAGAAGPVLQQPGEGRLHGRPLAPVDLMAQQGDSRPGRRGLKIPPCLGPAAVVHQDDLGKARPEKAVHGVGQPVRGVQGGHHRRRPRRRRLAHAFRLLMQKGLPAGRP